MTLLETTDARDPRYIPMSDFAVCLIDNRTRAEIDAMYRGQKDVPYYLDKLDRYLREHHSMDLKQYVITVGGIQWPKCPVSGEDVALDTERAKGLILRRFKNNCFGKSRDPRLTAHWERMRTTRVGEQNPMHGCTAWNHGLTAEQHPSLERIAKAQRGAKRSQGTIEHMKQGWARTSQRVRRTGPHSERTKEILRRRTAESWAKGCFSHVTSIHKAMRAFLATLPLTQPVKEEHQVVYYATDFAFPAAKVAIECDGDYFHINPRFYPDGPKTPVQWRNATRDKERNAFLAAHGWTVIHVWECDINAGVYQEPLKCKLRELGLLSPSASSAA